LTWAHVESGALGQIAGDKDRLAKLIDICKTQFREKFGRDPGPDDPVFPHLQEQGIGKTISMIIEEMRETDISPKFRYAFSKTGLMVTEANVNSLSQQQRRDWRRACEEFDELEAAGDPARAPPSASDRDRIARAHMLARRLVRYCFRDLLEPFHGTMGHKISEPEMRELMIALVNNVYTFLSLPEEIIADLPEPKNWNEPKADPDLVAWLFRLAGAFRTPGHDEPS
jgi:hypothetical protein